MARALTEIGCLASFHVFPSGFPNHLSFNNNGRRSYQNISSDQVIVMAFHAVQFHSGKSDPFGSNRMMHYDRSRNRPSSEHLRRGPRGGCSWPRIRRAFRVQVRQSKRPSPIVVPPHDLHAVRPLKQAKVSPNRSHPLTRLAALRYPGGTLSIKQSVTHHAPMPFKEAVGFLSRYSDVPKS